MNKNITVTLDFNQGLSNDIAILPTSIAVIAIQMYKHNLKILHPQTIINNFVDKILNLLDGNPSDMVLKAISEAQQFVETQQFNEMIAAVTEDFHEFDVESPFEIKS